MGEWRVIGERLSTADVSATPNLRVFKPVTPINKNFILQLSRSWFAMKNDVPFTSIKFHIYGNDNVTGLPTTKIATSTNDPLKAEIFQDLHGHKEHFWLWDDVPLRKDTKYHLIPEITGYAPTASAKLLWTKDWPDQVYRTGVTQEELRAERDTYADRFMGLVR